MEAQFGVESYTTANAFARLARLRWNSL